MEMDGTLTRVRELLEDASDSLARGDRDGHHWARCKLLSASCRTELSGHLTLARHLLVLADRLEMGQCVILDTLHYNETWSDLARQVLSEVLR